MKHTGCLALLAIFTLLGVFRLAAETQPASNATPLPCPAQKITFTQATGCQNDGSFEFCVPANDPAALEAVRAVVPDVSCIKAGGRARCHLGTQVLCMAETRGMCVADYGAMNDAGWQTVCDLASLPFVKQIVPTWYE